MFESSNFERVLLAAVALFLIVPAWLFGGVLASTQFWLLIAGIGILLLSLMGSLLGPMWRQAKGVPWIALPVVIGMVLGCLQLMPLPAATHQACSPTGFEWWTQLDSDSSIDEGVSTEHESRPLTMYPASTRRDLALLCLYLTALLIGYVYLGSSQTLLMLCAILATNGAILAFFGIAQQLTWNEKLFWCVPLTQGGTPFASFVNRNNAGGYLNMCFSGALAVLIWSVTRYRMIPAQVLSRRGRRTQYARVGFSEILASVGGTSILALIACIVILAGVLCSLSRGATLSLLCAAVVTTVVSSRVHRGIIGPTALLVVVVVGVVMTAWLGRGEILQERFAGLLDAEGIQREGRLWNWQDALGALRDFTWTGSGLGTYRHVYRPYEDTASNGWFYHAENQYLESAVEIGIMGPLLLILAIAMALRYAVRAANHKTDAEISAFGFAAIFAITSQAVHAALDFGLYLPANALLLAVICGACCGKCRVVHAIENDSRSRHFFLSALVLLVAVVAVWGAFEMRGVAAVEGFERKNRAALEDENPRGSDIDLQIAHYRLVAAVRPDDSQARTRLAQLYSRRYQASAVTQLQKSFPNAHLDNLRSLASPKFLHRRLHILNSRNNDSVKKQLCQHPTVRDLRPAYDNLLKAREGCPLLPKVHLSLAELCLVFDDTADDEVHVRHAVAAAPSNPTILFHAGLLELQAGRLDHGVELWSRCMGGSPEFWDEMIAAGPQLLGPAEFFRQVLAGDPDRMIRVAQKYYGQNEQQAIRRQLADLAQQELQDIEMPEEKYFELLGRIHRLRSEWKLATQAFSQALKLRPSEVRWRYQLADSYLQAGDLRQAEEAISLCIRLDRTNTQYRALQRKIKQQIKHQRR